MKWIFEINKINIYRLILIKKQITRSQNTINNNIIYLFVLKRHI